MSFSRLSLQWDNDSWENVNNEMAHLTSDPEETLSISVIIPAYNEAETIESVVRRTRQVMVELGTSYEVIVVDDGCLDDTAQRARSAGACVVAHPYNIGNGAAVKTGIRNARGRSLVMLDGDGQHAPEDIPRLLEHLGTHDMVVGARTRASDSGFHRDVANTVYNWFATYVAGRRIKDLTSGFRAVKADVAREFLYLLPNSFSYPTTITLAVLRSGRSLIYIPVRASRRIGRSKIRLMRDGPRFFLIIFRIATFFSPLKVFVPTSLLTFLVGFGYGLFKVTVWKQRYGPTSAMLMTMSLLVFLIGLVSEQVAQLRFHGREALGESQDPARTAVRSKREQYTACDQSDV